tara:strand:+ start:3789 stop:4730 length:942 start_codon:yes stop_codon:yes gene_type:complete
MIDPSRMTAAELEVLTGIAKSKGITVEAVLTEMGHTLPKPEDEPDAVVEFSGAAEVEEVRPAEIETASVRSISFGPDKSDRDLPELPEAKSALELPLAEEDEPEEREPEEQAGNDNSTLRPICAHCGWDQEESVIADPSSAEKVSFLQSVLGMKPFKKTMSLFAGQLKVTFRTLTIKEIDKLYSAAYEAQKAGEISTASDYYEYINRLRVHLQLLSVKGKAVPLHHQLPDGLDEQSNNTASEYWEDFLKEKKVYVENDNLPLQVQKYVIDTVLATEQLMRVVSFECQKFNRLAAKLEARVDDSDFWKETGQLS